MGQHRQWTNDAKPQSQKKTKPSKFYSKWGGRKRPPDGRVAFTPNHFVLQHAMAFQFYHPVPQFGRPYTPSEHSASDDDLVHPSSSIRGRNSLSMRQLHMPSPSLPLQENYHTSYTDLTTMRPATKRMSLDRVSSLEQDYYYLEPHTQRRHEEGMRKRSSSYRTRRDRSSIRTSVDISTSRGSVILVGSSDGVFHRSATVLAIVPDAQPALSQSLSLDTPLSTAARHVRTMTVPYDSLLLDHVQQEDKHYEYYEEEEDVVDPFLNRPYPYMSEYYALPRIIEPEQTDDHRGRKWHTFTRSVRDKAKDLFTKKEETNENFRKLDTFLLKRSWKKTSKQLDERLKEDDKFSFWNTTIFSKRKKSINHKSTKSDVLQQKSDPVDKSGFPSVPALPTVKK
jgi:hypothetical protein